MKDPVEADVAKPKKSTASTETSTQMEEPVEIKTTKESVTEKKESMVEAAQEPENEKKVPDGETREVKNTTVSTGTSPPPQSISTQVSVLTVFLIIINIMIIIMT